MVRRTALAALVLLALLAALATRGYDAGRLGRAALAEARSATGLDLEAESMRFRPLRGLELRGVHAAAPFPGGRYDVTLREVRLDHRLGSILRGRVDIERVVLVEPRILLTVGGDARAVPSRPRDGRSAPPAEDAESGFRTEPAAPAPGASSRIRFAVSQVRIDDGSLTIRGLTQAPPRLDLEGLRLDLESVRFEAGTLTLLHGIAGEGAVAMDALRFARTEVHGPTARVEAEGGRYALSELSFEAGGARFESSRIELDFNSIPFRYRLALRGRGTFPAILGGGASLRIDATGFGTSSRVMTGEGFLELAPGTLPDAPWVRSLQQAMGGALVGRSHEAARLGFRVESNQILLEPFVLEAAPYLIEAEGSIDLEGPVDLRLEITGGPSAEGRLRMVGTFENPKLEAEP